MQKIKLLLVEDEPILASVVKETLEHNGFDIVHAANGRQGWEKYLSHQPHACLIDIMMPEKDGFSLVKDIRDVDEKTPIIFLTGKLGNADVIRGLEYADDYIKKPFSLEELMLRIKNLLKRSLPLVPQRNIPGIFSLGKYIFDYNRQELKHPKDNQSLSLREADMLRMFSENANKTTSRKIMLEKLWGDDNIDNSRNMDVYISKLRKYLLYDTTVRLINVRGLGYRLVCNELL
ncbi:MULTISPECIES: response regulator transcription factor [unclassified Chitinophaga]|uniref:response regulator transcription factor n=1 Tax=unclassified Chitinophaga TaxID=2619133 RepID=UPI0030105B8C